MDVEFLIFCNHENPVHTSSPLPSSPVLFFPSPLPPFPFSFSFHLSFVPFYFPLHLFCHLIFPLLLFSFSIPFISAPLLFLFLPLSPLSFLFPSSPLLFSPPSFLSLSSLPFSSPFSLLPFYFHSFSLSFCFFPSSVLSIIPSPSLFFSPPFTSSSPPIFFSTPFLLPLFFHSLAPRLHFPLALCSLTSHLFTFLFFFLSPSWPKPPSSSTPLISSTVPVLAPPAPIDSAIANGHWAEVSRAGRGYFLHSMAVISSPESFVPPPTTPLPPPPLPPWPFQLNSPSSSPSFFFYLASWSLSFSLKLQDLSKYHAGLQTGRWQTIKGRCRLIISSALWLTSISLQRHCAAAGRCANM